jgi:cupin domain
MMRSLQTKPYLHIPYTEDIAVYVLKGTLTFVWGSEKREAVAGSFFYQPRGTPHGFHVEGTAPARILCMTMPAGFDWFILEHEVASQEAEADTAPNKIMILRPLIEGMEQHPYKSGNYLEKQETCMKTLLSIDTRAQVATQGKSYPLPST